MGRDIKAMQARNIYGRYLCSVFAGKKNRTCLHGKTGVRNANHLQTGFTLLEVVVALAVVALALSAIIQSSSGYIANQAYLRDRTMAHWVARNALIEWQLVKGWPGTGEHSGTAEFADQEWDWRVQVTQTEEEQMRRLDIEVRRPEDEANVLAVISGFVKKSGNEK